VPRAAVGIVLTDDCLADPREARAGVTSPGVSTVRRMAAFPARTHHRYGYLVEARAGM
jgi:hypothetical protein